jgi:hypothetical protein
MTNAPTIYKYMGWDGPQYAKAAEYLEICTGEKLDGWKAYEDALIHQDSENCRKIWQNWKAKRRDEPGEIKIIVECR